MSIIFRHFIILTILFYRPIDGIIFLSTFDSNGSALFFQESAPNSIFRGPGNKVSSLYHSVIIRSNVTHAGPMSIVGAYAYFQLFAIDPRVSFVLT